MSEPDDEYTWCAFHDENDIEETHRHFSTWREAMQYADRKARTVEVVLPRDTVTPQRGGGDKQWVARRRPNDYEIYRTKYGRKVQAIRVGEPDLQPLATALLLLHYREMCV